MRRCDAPRQGCAAARVTAQWSHDRDTKTDTRVRHSAHDAHHRRVSGRRDRRPQAQAHPGTTTMPRAAGWALHGPHRADRHPHRRWAVMGVSEDSYASASAASPAAWAPHWASSTGRGPRSSCGTCRCGPSRTTWRCGTTRRGARAVRRSVVVRSRDRRRERGRRRAGDLASTRRSARSSPSSVHRLHGVRRDVGRRVRMPRRS